MLRTANSDAGLAIVEWLTQIGNGALIRGFAADQGSQ